jgi:hypothetical protein|tara:strand:- start:120 stop:365 length:246 start_codon:yes stop_codon:yes gene_type:complete
MANSTINVEIDVMGEEVSLEVEVQWHTSEANELTIDDFYAYALLGEEVERIPYWMHKIIERTNLLEEYYEDIENNCDDSEY